MYCHLSIIASLGTILQGVLFAGAFSLGLKYYITGAVIAFIAQILSFYISAIVIDMLAPSFGSEKTWVNQHNLLPILVLLDMLVHFFLLFQYLEFSFPLQLGFMAFI
jgi:hypothetical protein